MFCKSLEEEKAMSSFFALEQECDEHNAKQLEAMDLSHLGKGKLNKARRYRDQWDKVNTRNEKWVDRQASLHPHKRHRQTSKERTWLMKDSLSA